MIEHGDAPGSASPALSDADARKFRTFLREELQAARRYSMLGRAERDPERRAAFMKMSGMELRHAAHWARLLGEDGARLRPGGLSPSLILLGVMARAFGPARLLPFLVRGESSAAKDYAATPEAAPLLADERAHEYSLRRMAGGKAEDGQPHPEGGFLRGEGGALRAAVLGINDGLVSNFSLVMGVAGGTNNPELIVLAGVAGLLAGAFSMAAGEYISMKSQRDVYEHMIARERAEIEQWPSEEQEELAYIYRRKGLTKAEADLVARRLMEDREVALATKVREELGLDPDDLGSPWGAALSSMLAFVTGAIVPILPFLLGAEGNAGAGISAALSAGALALVGAGLAWFSGISALWGAARMLLAGGAAAGVTYGVGRAIGVSVN
jgi:VIT1/CCC1 family predicted Fe2+/Mn2+ transporter